MFALFLMRMGALLNARTPLFINIIGLFCLLSPFDRMFLISHNTRIRISLSAFQLSIGPRMKIKAQVDTGAVCRASKSEGKYLSKYADGYLHRPDRIIGRYWDPIQFDCRRAKLICWHQNITHEGTLCSASTAKILMQCKI